jgi:hypothetical protein
MNKTIAQQLNIKKFPFIIKDDNGNVIYSETSAKYWEKTEYDSNGNVIYYENSNKFWEKTEYDSNGNVIYFETSAKYWEKTEYDSNGNRIYYEDSNGRIVDYRSKKTEITLSEIAEKFGISVNELRIKE